MIYNRMSSFAAGLIVAATVCGATYFLDPKEVTSKQVIEKPSDEEMKEQLASTGYIIFSKKEWEEQVAVLEAKEATKVNPVDKGKETLVYRTILNVSPGMTSIDVGKVLVQANITDNAMSFFNEVEKRGLSNDLRPGTYEVDSDMTIDEVISIIFK
jgi:UTP-glucose-1-phosphate uridylyltransferase